MIPLIIQDQFYPIQNLQRSPILQTNNWSGIFFCCFLQQTGSKLKVVQYDGISKRDQKVAIQFKRHFDQSNRKNKEPDLTILGMKRKNGTDYRYMYM